MTVIQNSTVLAAGTQQLFRADCPVHVHRWQLTDDRLGGRRLLQVRLVNVSGKTVTGVRLRVVCMDRNGSRCNTVPAFTMAGLAVRERALFGEDKVIRVNDTVTEAVRVYPERVTFADGSAWNGDDPADWLTLPAAEPLEGAEAEQLRAKAKSHSYRADYRFREYDTGWYCTCGLPNGAGKSYCSYCGTGRDWLRANMTAVPAEKPAPEKPAAVPAPVQERPAPTVIAVPAPVEIPRYIPVSRPEPAPQRTPEQEFPVIYPREPKKEPVGAGLIIGIILLVLAILAAVGFCTYRYLMPAILGTDETEAPATTAAASETSAVETVPGNEPSGTAVPTEAPAVPAETESPEEHEGTEISLETGSWIIIPAQTEAPVPPETASTDVPEVPTAPTEPAQTEIARYNEAIEKMSAGNYADAYEAFKSLGTFNDSDKRAADCLYSMGVLAYNAGDTASAWSYQQQLDAEYPGYSGSETLYQCCCYTFGKEAVDAGNYDAASEWFTQAGNYSNSKELVQYCSYQNGLARMGEGDFAAAAEIFAKLGEYSDSSLKYQTCMYNYVVAHPNREDEKTLSFLLTLKTQGYKPADDLYDSIYGWDIKVVANEKKDDTTTDTKSFTTLSKLYLHISVTGGVPNGDKLGVLLMYTMPDGTSGSTSLCKNTVDGFTDAISWESLKLSVKESTGNVVLKFVDDVSGTVLTTVTLELKP